MRKLSAGRIGANNIQIFFWELSRKAKYYFFHDEKLCNFFFFL